MFYKVMHYISKYSLMLLIYSLVVALAFKVFGISYSVLILTTLIYIFLIIKKKSWHTSFNVANSFYIPSFIPAIFL